MGARFFPKSFSIFCAGLPHQQLTGDFLTRFSPLDPLSRAPENVTLHIHLSFTPPGPGLTATPYERADCKVVKAVGK